jgi:hypothetical protein
MHDYDPTWDYTPIARPADPALDAAEARVRGRLMRLLGLESLTLFFVARAGLGAGRIALYVAGTGAHPVIGLDPAAHRAADDGLTPELRYLASLAHELAHAYLETLGVDPADHDEDAVEDFARDLAHESRARIGDLRGAHHHLLT